MARASKEVVVVNKFGLHARPATKLMKLAASFESSVEVSSDVLTVDAKSIMSVIQLAATKGTKLTITADGKDAEEACQAISNLIAEGFGQTEPGADADGG